MTTMLKETTILLEKLRVITLPKELRERLIEKGWVDGPVFILFDDAANSLRVVQPSQVGIVERSEKTKKKDAPEMICTYEGAYGEYKGYELIKKVY